MDEDGPFQRCWLILAGLDGQVRRGWQDAAGPLLRDFKALPLDERERLISDTSAKTRTQLEGHYLAGFERNCASFDQAMARNAIENALWLVSLANFDIDYRDEILTFEEFLRCVNRAGLHEMFDEVWADMIPQSPARIVTMINDRIAMGFWRD